MAIAAGDVISGLALLLSAYATWITLQFNKRQQQLIESQEGLNLLALAKGQSDATAEKKADLGASFITLGRSNHRLKIWNKGKGTARQVRIEFPDGNEIVIQSEIDDKLPLETLETHQAVELIAAVAMGTRRKHAIRLIWADDFQERNEKLVYPTL